MLKAAVVGVGYLGNFHAQKYQALNNVELIGVSDIDQNRAEQIAKTFGVTAYPDYHALIGHVDCVSIVVSTKAHYEVAKFFLEQGVHVLLEKPMTETVLQATHLVSLAKEKKVVLQVGHLERFNATVVALAQWVDHPLFIESTRIAPFNLRGSDVNVILDLMIHDIDIIQSIVQSPVKKIDANGAAVISSAEDIANARITYDNGCVANVTASRVSIKSERKLRLFQHNAYFSLDLQSKQLVMYQKGEGELFPGIPNIKHQTFTYEDDDALLAEINAFIEAIIHHKSPVVSGEDGLRSLETAIAITQLVQAGASV